MAGLRSYERARGSVHDLVRALSYGAGGCHVLLVSDSTLQILQDLADMDVEFAARYALVDHGEQYEPISEDAPEYAAWIDLVDRVQTEVYPVTCDITGVLQQIADSQAALADALAAIDVNVRVLSRQSNLACCYDTGAHPWSPQAPSEDPPASPGYDLCHAAAYLWYDAKASFIETTRLTVDYGQLGLAVLGAALSLLDLPVGLLLEVAVLLVEVAETFTIEQLSEALDNIAQDIICAIVTAQNALAAQNAIKHLLEESELGVAASVLVSLFQKTTLDAVFDNTYPQRPDAPIYDCTCAPVGTLLMTATTSPFDGVVVGEATDVHADASGFSVVYNSWDAVFNTVEIPEGTTDLELTVEIYSLASDQVQVGTPYMTGISFPWALMGTNGEWNESQFYHHIEGGLEGGIYEFGFTAEYQQTYSIRRISLVGSIE
jgi:hypothetical protein